MTRLHAVRRRLIERRDCLYIRESAYLAKRIVQMLRAVAQIRAHP